MVGIRRFCFVLVAGCSLASCGGSPGIDNSQQPDAGPEPPAYDFTGVDSVIEAFVAEHAHIAGATLAVVRRGESQIYEQAYGEFELDRVSFIASTGKTLTVVVILTLADEGLIDMDRPVAEYLGWGDHQPGVTMRHILSMMSGIPAPSSGDFDDWFEDPCRRDPTTTLQDCARTVFQDETRTIPPMQEFRYSGASWQIAGAVAEIVTGQPWAVLVERWLASPCGLNATGYGNNGGTNAYPSDFDGDPDSLPETANPSLGGGAYSTVNDYSKVLLMHLHDGLCGDVRVLSEASVEAMQEDLVPDGVAMPIWRYEAINYGMGWWKYENEPTLLIDPGAYGARAYLDPEEGWGAIVILEARTVDGRALREALVPAIRAAAGAAKED